MHARIAALVSALCLAAPAALPAASEAGDAPPAPPSEASPATAPEPREPAARLDDRYLAELETHRAEAYSRARSLEATLPLLRAFGLRDRLSSLAPLARLYGEFASSSSVQPEVRSLARYLLSLVQRSRGRLPAAQDQLSKLGFVTRGWLAGPFDNEGKSGCDTAWPPEKELDLGARFPGKVREIGWRRLPDLVRDGFVDLSPTVSPTDEPVAYVLAVVEVPSDQRVVLHLGASGATRLFVNGTKVLSDDAYHPARFDQAQVGVTLKRGANRVLLKLCQLSGPAGFFLRVSGPNGDALANATISAPDPLPPQPKGAVARETIPTALDAFRKKAELPASKGRPAPEAVAEYAEMLFLKRVSDPKDRREATEAARAAQVARDSVGAQLLAAATADDSNERRRYLESELATAPLNPAVGLALARHFLGHDQPRRALDLLLPLARANPGDFQVGLALARAYLEVGLPYQYQQIMQDLERTFPDRPDVVREAARQRRMSDRARDSVALLRVAIALRFDDLESRRMLVSALAALGDVEGALKEQREITALDPWDVPGWLRLAELASANDKGEDARAAFAKATAIAPEDADVFDRQGQALARSGDTEGAIASFTRALELKPQSPRVKEALKALKREGRGFGEDLAYDAVKLAAELPPSPGEDAVALADFTAVKVLPSGLAFRFEQTVIRVQTARGVEAQRNQWITYSPDRQDLKILRARVIRPDGSLVESHQESERSLSDTSSRLYYDTRGRIVSFPNLAPGDVLELSWRREDTANDNLLSDYFGDVSGIQSDLPKARFDYVLSMPPGRPLFANAPTVKLEKTEQAQPDGSRLYRWSARDVPKIVPEPAMPGLSEVAAQLHVSTYSDWDAVGRFYWGLVRDELVPTDEIKAALKDILADVPKGDELAAVRAVYDFVVTRTRYVGLEFGIHGYKPYKVDKVLSRRFGDCKDKASLMHALLEAAGIDSRLVLLRMRHLGIIDPVPASLAIFDHAILYVPKYDLWLDGTAELYGSRELPSEDTGAQVLVVEPKGGSKLGRIPYGKAEANLTASEFDVALSADGQATISAVATASGLAAPGYRRSFQQADGARERFEQGWAQTFPGIRVRRLDLSNLAELEKDVRLTFEMEAPAWASREGDTLSFTPFGQGTTYVESYAPLSSRKLDLVLVYPWTHRFTYRIALPAGTKAEPPKDVDVQSPFGAIKLTYRLADGGSTLIAEGALVMGVSRVAAADYPAFRTFLGQVDQTLGRRVRVSGAVQAPTTSAR